MELQIHAKPNQSFIDDYDLQCKTKDGFVYMEIRKGMYGLPWTSILATNWLQNY